MRSVRTARAGSSSAVHDYGAGASLEIDRDNRFPLLVPFTAGVRAGRG
jgi:hypothetical protein